MSSEPILLRQETLKRIQDTVLSIEETINSVMGRVSNIGTGTGTSTGSDTGSNSGSSSGTITLTDNEVRTKVERLINYLEKWIHIDDKMNMDDLRAYVYTGSTSGNASGGFVDSGSGSSSGTGSSGTGSVATNASNNEIKNKVQRLITYLERWIRIDDDFNMDDLRSYVNAGGSSMTARILNVGSTSTT